MIRPEEDLWKELEAKNRELKKILENTKPNSEERRSKMLELRNAKQDFEQDIKDSFGITNIDEAKSGLPQEYKWYRKKIDAHANNGKDSNKPHDGLSKFVLDDQLKNVLIWDEHTEEQIDDYIRLYKALPSIFDTDYEIKLETFKDKKKAYMAKWQIPSELEDNLPTPQYGAKGSNPIPDSIVKPISHHIIENFISRETLISMNLYNGLGDGSLILVMPQSQHDNGRSKTTKWHNAILEKCFTEKELELFRAMCKGIRKNYAEKNHAKAFDIKGFGQVSNVEQEIDNYCDANLCLTINFSDDKVKLDQFKKNAYRIIELSSILIYSKDYIETIYLED